MPLPTLTPPRHRVSQRMFIVHGALFVAFLIIVSRLIELQILQGAEFRERAQSQHFSGVTLPARRGEILAMNSKTNETSILATNTTLDLLYVDPMITDDPALIAETLADILLTEDVHTQCAEGKPDCPQELILFYKPAFDPMVSLARIQSGVLLERLSSINVHALSPLAEDLPDLIEARRLFARDIEKRISERRLTFVPLLYGATKVQMRAIDDLNIPGISVSWKQKIIFANPEEVNQSQLASIARKIGQVIEQEPTTLRYALQARNLRYVPIMRRLSPKVSLQIKEKKLEALRESQEQKSKASTHEEAERIASPLRSIALLPEHWRFYPDGTIASHVIGFLNTNQEPQYGIERTLDPILRGQKGLIQSLSDTQGGQILTAEQQVIDPKDGDTVVLTIDRNIQKETERVLADTVRRYEADSGQVIIMDPYTGRILAMANAPLFDGNAYGSVYERAPVVLSEEEKKGIVVEVYHPKTNTRIVKAYRDDVFTEEGQKRLSEKTQEAITEIETLYELKDIARYFVYLGEHNRHEIFPTSMKGIWMKYDNNIGVGAYINRTIQEIYEPGSVMKPVTMAIALDHGEITPYDTFNDEGPLEVDEYKIKNALNRYYGQVTMVNCIEKSINTCMTNISAKMGKKLFYRSLQRFGFGRITGIELDDELPGEVPPWKKWSQALLATAAFGQGVSVTPLQMVTAMSALANGGRLMRPIIIDHVIHGDGAIERTQPEPIDQVIKPETAETISAILVSAVDNGYAKTAKVKGYRIAGKTGTSQIAGPGGKYETGTGAFITSFAGFAPIDHPRFVGIVKIDRPRNVQWGAEVAAPAFKEIATFLFKYYGIPPDDL